MSVLLGEVVKGNEAGSAVSTPVNISDVVNSFQNDGTTNVITWENIAKWIGARAAADVANVKLATLENGVVPGSQLPFTGFEFKGDYNPATNTPALANADTGKANWVYRIVGSANPTARDFGAGSINMSDDEYLAYAGDSGSGAWSNIGQGATKQIGEGGTGATTVAGARSNLELYSKGEVNDRTNALQSSNALVFNGSTSELSIGDQALLEPGADADFAVAFSFYFETNPTVQQYLLTKRSGSPGFYTFINTSGRLGGYIQDSGGSVTSSNDGDSLAGEWHRFVITFNRDGNMTRYVDSTTPYGSEDAISAISGDLANSATAYIGRAGGGGGNFGGLISDVQYLNLAPSTDDIARYMSTGQFPSSYQWANDTEVLSNSDMASWASASNADNWNEGSSTTVAQDGTNKYSGSYAMHYTSSGNAISSGVNHQVRQGDLVQPGWNKVEIVLKNASAGSFEFGVNNTKLISFDGTTVTEFESGYQTAYPGSALGSVTKKDLGSGWFRLTVYHKLSNALPRDFVMGGTGQWYIDSANNKKSGITACYLPENIQSDGDWVDASPNKLNTTSSGVTPLSIPTPQSAHSPSDASTDMVEQITAGAASTVIHKRMGNGIVKDCPIASQRVAGQGYQEVIVTGSVADNAEWVLDDNMLGTQPRGFVEITQSGGSALHICLAALQGQAGAPVLVSDPFSNWSITKDTASKVNLYRDTANSNKTTIQNRTGGSLNFTIYLKSYYLA